MSLLVLHSLRPEFRSLVTAALSELGGPDSPSDPLSYPSSQLEDKLPGKREPLPIPLCEGGSELLALAMFGHAQLNLPQLLHLAAAAVLKKSAEKSMVLYDCALINSDEELAEYSVTTLPGYMGVMQVCDIFVYEYLLQRTFRTGMQTFTIVNEAFGWSTCTWRSCSAPFSAASSPSTLTQSGSASYYAGWFR